jgi:uncharacterized repeat protein (TIGR01451 family)
MKKKISFILILFYTYSFSQVVYIPDANFKNGLINSGVDANYDGQIQYSEAFNVHNLYNLDGLNISDFTGIEAFMQLATLDISYNPVTQIDLSSNSNLIYLTATHCQLTNIDISDNGSLDRINIEYNSLTSLNLSGVYALSELNANHNLISSIDLSPLQSIETIDLSNNLLTELDVSHNEDLEILRANFNFISSINLLGAISLRNLYLDNNQFTSFTLNTTTPFNNLVLSNNQIQTIDLSNSTRVFSLDVSNNLLTAFDANVNHVSIFTANNNQFSSLDFSNNLIINQIIVNNNSLTSLITSGATYLGKIEAKNNLLTSIDISDNPYLYFLNLRYNQLTEIVGLSGDIEKFDCSYNQFTSLDFSNLTVLGNNVSGDFLFNGNPNLLYINFKNGYNSEIPNYIVTNNFSNNLTSVQSICVDDADSSFANLIEYSTPQDIIFTEYCSFTPGNSYYTINGNIIFDSTNNGCNEDDIDYPNLAIQISNGIYDDVFYTNSYGNINIPVQDGFYTITPILENPNYFNINPSSQQVIFPNQLSPFTQNFCITPNGIHHDLEISILPLGVARPGFDTSYKLVFKNKGNTQLSGQIHFIFDENILSFIYSSAFPSNQSFGLLEWNFGDLQPFETRVIELTFYLNSSAQNPSVNLGDLLTFSSAIYPIVDDQIESDNHFELNQIVVGSFDPNDKTCLEGTNISSEKIGDFIHYLIRFENTGTFYATNIVVKDIIDVAKFDVSTLQITHFSHECVTRIMNTNEVEFIFENINLSFEDEINDGFIAFKIKIKPTIGIGSTLENKADIFFDYNSPITTNEFVSTIQTLIVPDNAFFSINLFPNPVYDFLTIRSNSSILKIEIYGMDGRLIQIKSITDNKVNLSELKSGDYLIKVFSNKGVLTKKMVKK